jgi:rubrerythrin
MASTPNGIRSATREDLLTALRSEAFAQATYLLYAAAARARGRGEIADLFEETARTELERHIAQLAGAAALVGDEPENLREAIEGATYALEIMYPSFAEHAEAAGDAAAAAAFTSARADHVDHLEALREALETVV